MKGWLCLAFAVDLVDARIALSRFPFYASLLVTKEFRFSDLFFPLFPSCSGWRDPPGHAVRRWTAGV